MPQQPLVHDRLGAVEAVVQSDDVLLPCAMRNSDTTLAQSSRRFVGPRLSLRTPDSARPKARRRRSSRSCVCAALDRLQRLAFSAGLRLSAVMLEELRRRQHGRERRSELVRSSRDETSISSRRAPFRAVPPPAIRPRRALRSSMSTLTPVMRSAPPAASRSTTLPRPRLHTHPPARVLNAVLGHVLRLPAVQAFAKDLLHFGKIVGMHHSGQFVQVRRGFPTHPQDDRPAAAQQDVGPARVPVPAEDIGSLATRRSRRSFASLTCSSKRSFPGRNEAFRSAPVGGQIQRQEDGGEHQNQDSGGGVEGAALRNSSRSAA